MQRVRLLVPALLGPIAESARMQLPELPALETILARGRALPVVADDIETLIAAQFVDAATVGPIPSAALGLYGDQGEPGTDYWLRADPVRLEADRDSVMLLVDDLQVTRDEADALAAAFNTYFAADGLHLEVATPERWYLRAQTANGVNTPPTERVAGRYFDAFLPSGDAGKRLAAWLNEAQMLLFTHPVNERRRELGLPMVNGVWLWGGGCLPAPPDAATGWERIQGDHPSLRGWARLLGRTVEPVVDVLARERGDGTTLSLLDGAREALVQGNLNAWEAELARLENEVLAPLVAAVRVGTIATLEVVTEQAGWRLGRGELRRFWRRRRALAHAIRR